MFDFEQTKGDCADQIAAILLHFDDILDNLDGLNEDNFEPVANNLINASINARDALGLLEKGKKRQ